MTHLIYYHFQLLKMNENLGPVCLFEPKTVRGWRLCFDRIIIFLKDYLKFSQNFSSCLV